MNYFIKDTKNINQALKCNNDYKVVSSLSTRNFFQAQITSEKILLKLAIRLEVHIKYLRTIKPIIGERSHLNAEPELVVNQNT